MGRTLVAASAVGVLVSLTVVTLAMLAAGQVWQSSLALGAFVALWGGLGFGSMVGGVVYLTRLETARAVEGPPPAGATPATEPRSRPAPRSTGFAHQAG